MNARSSSRASQHSPPIPWSAARGALKGASGSRRRPPNGHRRGADPPCQCHVSTHDERAHAWGDHGPRVNGGQRDGLLAIRGQAVTYLRSRLPSRTRASTFCVVDQCGYGDNRTYSALPGGSRSSLSTPNGELLTNTGVSAVLEPCPTQSLLRALECAGVCPSWAQISAQSQLEENSLTDNCLS